MKRSEELKIQRKATIDEMQGIVDGAKEKGKARSLTDDEQTKYDELKARAASLKTQIDDALALEADQAAARSNEPAPAPIPAPHIQRKASKVYNVSAAIRSFSDNGQLTGLEADAQSELQRQLGIRTKGILIPTAPIFKEPSARANENTTTTHAAITETFVDPDVSIFGLEPLYQKLGATVLNGVHGSIKLTKKSPSTGQQVAQEAALSNNSDDPSTGDTLTPKRYGDMDVWTAELFAQQNPAIHQKLLADLVKGCDRKLTADVYTHILAAATAEANGAITEAGLNALMAKVDGDGSFIMSRSTFFEGKAVKFDTGSGLRLLNMVSGQMGVGATWEGVPAFYSSLFNDGTNKKYVAYGDMSELYIAMWGVLEVLIDPYTLAANGESRVIVNRLADMGIRNSAAFAVSPDLDPA